MDKRLCFLITIHFHQPVGNFDSVIERICKCCYEPFLETISEFPDIKFNLHYSGSLLEWIKGHRPGLLSAIKKVVKSGQVELLGGGFYEPILSVLPPQDSIEQIRMMSRFLKNEFTTEPSGAWLPERVWEPHLADIFANAGIKYTIVDDTHLRYAGLKQPQLYNYYITEDNTNTVAIFPSDKTLRYTIPFHGHQDTIDYFKKVKDEYGQVCVLYGDDGEKFGEWPGTNDLVYKQKWLYNFLSLLQDNNSWLSTMKISDYMSQNGPSGRIYMPTSSYEEMGEWALPAESSQRLSDIITEYKNNGAYDRYIDFIRGGFWRNFFVKYPESNQMHKRMVLVSKRLAAFASKVKGKVPQLLDDARRELLRSQCNCAYWHGVFGGLYLYHLRSAIYEHIVSAEGMLDRLIHGSKRSWLEAVEEDFDCDGHKEVIVNTPYNTFTIDPGEGGIITEWDLKPHSLNIINTLSRKREAYHSKLKINTEQPEHAEAAATIHENHFSNEKLKSKVLRYDDTRRAMCIDRFIDDSISIGKLADNTYEDKGDFVNSRYSCTKVDTKKDPCVELQRQGTVNQKPLKLQKRFIFHPDSSRVTVEYELTNMSKDMSKFCFAPELNFSLTQDKVSKEMASTDSLLVEDKIRSIRMEITFSEKADRVFRYPVETVSQSEKDIEKNYQASCVIPVFIISLKGQKSRSLSIDIRSK